MDVSSISKPTVQPAAPPKRAEPVAQKAAPETTQSAPTPPAPARSEPAPKPVINTQGQVTGRHLNVSA